MDKEIKDQIFARAAARRLKYSFSQDIKQQRNTHPEGWKTPYHKRKEAQDPGFLRSRERQKITDKERYMQNKGKGEAKSVLSNIRNRARKNNMCCTITLEDLIAPKVCPVLGIPLKGWGENFGLKFDSPSVDRIDSNKGYTKDNIRVISWRANRLKSDASIEEVRRVLAYMEENNPPAPKITP